MSLCAAEAYADGDIISGHYKLSVCNSGGVAAVYRLVEQRVAVLVVVCSGGSDLDDLTLGCIGGLYAVNGDNIGAVGSVVGSDLVLLGRYEDNIDGDIALGHGKGGAVNRDRLAVLVNYLDIVQSVAHLCSCIDGNGIALNSGRSIGVVNQNSVAAVVYIGVVLVDLVAYSGSGVAAVVGAAAVAGITGIAGVAVIGTNVCAAVIGAAGGAAICNNSGGYGNQQGLAGLDDCHVALAVESHHQSQIVVIVDTVSLAEIVSSIAGNNFMSNNSNACAGSGSSCAGQQQSAADCDAVSVLQAVDLQDSVQVGIVVDALAQADIIKSVAGRYYIRNQVAGDSITGDQLQLCSTGSSSGGAAGGSTAGHACSVAERQNNLLAYAQRTVVLNVIGGSDPVIVCIEVDTQLLANLVDSVTTLESVLDSFNAVSGRGDAHSAEETCDHAYGQQNAC